MGKGEIEEFWIRRLEKIIDELSGKFQIEAVIVFGSWVRGGGGDWSDLDVLIVSDEFKGLDVLKRFEISALYRPLRIDLFLYTYDELVNMVRRMNPLAISALAEGILIRASERVLRLMDEVRNKFVRKGRVWIDKSTLNLNGSKTRLQS